MNTMTARKRKTDGQKFRELRLAQGFTQSSLAAASGISHRQIIRIEKDEASIGPTSAPCLRLILGSALDPLIPLPIRLNYGWNPRREKKENEK